ITTLSGTSEANSAVSIFDGTKPIGTVTTAANGTWSLQTAKVTGMGIHNYTETSIDVAGNTGSSAGHTYFAQSAGKQTLQGTTGDGGLIAGQNFTLNGGAGSDTFVFNPGFGKNT